MIDRSFHTRAGLLLLLCLAGCAETPEQKVARWRADPSHKNRSWAGTQDQADGVETGTEAGPYLRADSRHYIVKTLEEGRVIVLDDGSLWEIVENDRVLSVSWRAMQDIVVIDLLTAPHYRVVNTTTHEQVMATYLGVPG